MSDDSSQKIPKIIFSLIFILSLPMWPLGIVIYDELAILALAVFVIVRQKNIFINIFNFNFESLKTILVVYLVTYPVIRDLFSLITHFKFNNLRQLVAHVAIVLTVLLVLDETNELSDNFIVNIGLTYLLIYFFYFYALIFTDKNWHLYQGIYFVGTTGASIAIFPILISLTRLFRNTPCKLNLRYKFYLIVTLMLVLSHFYESRMMMVSVIIFVAIVIANNFSKLPEYLDLLLVSFLVLAVINSNFFSYVESRRLPSEYKNLSVVERINKDLALVPKASTALVPKANTALVPKANTALVPKANTATISPSDSDWDRRLHLTCAFQVISENFDLQNFLGYGPNSHKIKMIQCKALSLYIKPQMKEIRSNTISALLIDYGILYFLAMLLVCIGNLFKLIKVRYARNLAIIYLMALVSPVFGNFSDSLYLWLFLILGFPNFNFGNKLTKTGTSSKKSP